MAGEAHNNGFLGTFSTALDRGTTNTTDQGTGTTVLLFDTCAEGAARSRYTDGTGQQVSRCVRDSTE